MRGAVAVKSSGAPFQGIKHSVIGLSIASGFLMSLFGRSILSSAQQPCRLSCLLELDVRNLHMLCTITATSTQLTDSLVHRVVATGELITSVEMRGVTCTWTPLTGSVHAWV
jgi:energy-converting hydrogenase Eha subunit G